MELAVDDDVGSAFDGMILGTFGVFAEAAEAIDDMDELNPFNDSPPEGGNPLA